MRILKNTGMVILMLLLCGVGNTSFAGGDRAKKSYKRAKKHLRKYDYIKAIPELKNSVNLEPGNAEYSFLLGKCFYEADRVVESLPHFIRAYNMDPVIDDNIEFYLARAFHLSNEFEEALEHYRQAVIKVDDLTIREFAEMGIQQCQGAREVYEDHHPFAIENIGEFVNSRFPDYGASFAEDFSYMVYTSRRPRKPQQQFYGNYLYEDINEEVYKAEKINDIWMKAELFAKPILQMKHDAGVTLSEDGNTLLFYVDKNYGDIYISEKKDGEWSKRKSLGKNINTEYNEPSVCFADNGNTIIFVSDKPGGSGKKDLYMAYRNIDGTFGDAKNLGDKINSEYDEDGPYVTLDGKELYYSSRGLNSMGGYDVFKCDRMDDGTWSDPENLGSPINSAADDIYYIPHPENEGFFLSSDRAGGYGGMDIYFGYYSEEEKVIGAETKISGNIFDINSEIPMDATISLTDIETGKVLMSTTTNDSGNYDLTIPSGGNYALDLKVKGKKARKRAREKGKINIVAGTIVDDINGTPLMSAVELVDPESGEVLETAYSNKANGHYIIPVVSGTEYLFRVKSTGYITYYEEFSVSSSGRIEAHSYQIGLQKNNDANRIVLSWQFFGFNEYELKDFHSEDLSSIIEVMSKVPSMRLRIVGHTDNVGSDEYNAGLSTRRAGAVAKFINERGIELSRLEVQGAGELAPLYDNNVPRLRKWNRRVELFILN